uniref:Uncharacterized protein n=1 Tax=Amorphochlora amoebiformis TaxID=1561963 RepID=A0A7S0DVA6_9EUKA|mmetsp:Transcript_8006/g.12445  ORF Transcript_8006/g.12445 Transcript_8006/m.12445 type:complete len:5390 (+) Transcript_8006:97-16266(+)
MAAIADDPNFMEGEPEWSYDESDPEWLLNKTLSVHWPKMNKWYQGTVDKWDEEKGNHHITYTDGDRRWTRFRERTFSVIGLAGRHEAEECEKYQPKFKGYIPKNSEARSPCHFHVMLDAKWLPENHTPVLLGNLPIMGEWEGKGVLMQRSQVDPRMFNATVELPFERKEFCNTGIFEYKIGIQGADGKLVLEGGLNRRIKTCNLHYYSILRKNGKKGKNFFKGYNQPTVAQTVVSTVTSDFQLLLEEKIPLRDFVNRSYFLHGSYKKTTRDQGEECMEKGLKMLAEAKVTNKDPLVPFALLSVIGVHGPSKFEFTEGVGGSKKPLGLKPSAWCWYVLKNVDVVALMKTDLKESLGPHFLYCTAGLREAADRVMDDEGYQWLRVAPFLKEKKFMPVIPQPPNAGLNKTLSQGERVRCNYKGRGTFYPGYIARVNSNGTFFVHFDDNDKEDNVEEDRIELEKGSKKAMKKRAALTKSFDKQWKEIMALAISTLVASQSAIEAESGKDAKAKTDDAAIAAALAAEDGKDAKKESEGQLLNRIGLEYLRTLITYAPCTASLGLLFTPEMVIYLKDVIQAVANWITSAQWVLEEIPPLRKLVEQYPMLHAPEIAAALFKSKSCVTDEKKFVGAILDFTELCCTPHVIDFKAEDDPGADMKEGEKKANSELLAKFVKLDQAAYGWFKAGFSMRPAMEERVQVRDNFVVKWETKKLTGPEQEIKLTEALEEACDVINRIMQNQYFLHRPQSMLFELGRCRCLKGESSVVLKTICNLGHKYEGFMNYKLPLAEFLTQRAEKILAEVVPVVAKDQKELSKLLDSIAVLRKESALSHKLLYTLAATAGGGDPSLNSILNFEVIWNLLFKTRGSSPGDWKQDTQLNKLLALVHKRLMDTAMSVAQPTSEGAKSDKETLGRLKQFWGLAGLDTKSSKSQLEQMLQQGYEDISYNITHVSAMDADWKEMANTCGISEADSKTLRAACGKFGAATMATMNVIRQHQEQFLTLLRNIGSLFDREMLNTQLSIMSAFDTLLSQTNTFLNFYCDCGVPIQMVDMQKKIKQWTEGYNSLKLRQIKGLFPSLFTKKKYEEAAQMEWLSELQTSRLFLSQWRTSGRWLIAKKSGRDMKTSSKFAALDEEKDSRKLTRKEVFAELLPYVRREWKQLMVSVGNGSIGVPRLEETFATLSSDEEYVRELLLLVSTGEGKVGGKVKWTEEAITKLKDFSMLLHMKNSIPAILKLRTKMLVSLFKANEKKDKLYKQLKDLDEQLKAQWNSKTLRSLTELVAPVKKNLGAQLTSVQLRFLTILADKNSEQMVEWLLKQKNQNQFNQMKQFVNDSGGEANIVNAVASLVTLRTALLRLLYQAPPYASLKEMIGVFRNDVDMQSGELCGHLESVTQSFAALYRIIKGGKESAGIKACKDIIHFLNHGILSFKSSSDSNDVLVLEPHWEKKNDKGKDQKAPSASQAAKKTTKIRTESLEYLLDLRSKIVMTEIPAKMEREHKMSRLVAKFLDQLQVALDIKALIFSLFQKGHFAFQTGYSRKIAFSLTDDQDFQKEYQHLLKELSTWNTITKQARTNFYYLNFFTMREILKLVDLLLGDNSKWRPKRDALTQHDKLKEEAKKEDEGKDSKADALPKTWRCSKDGFMNKIEFKACLMCGTIRPEKYAKLIDAAGGIKKRKRSRSPSYREQGVQYDSGKDIAAMLNLVTSSVNVKLVQKAFSEHSKKLKDGLADIEKHKSEAKETDGLIFKSSNIFKLESLGNMLNDLLEESSKKPKEGKEGKAKEAASRQEGKGKAPEGRVLANFRAIRPPGRNAKNRADMLVSVDEESLMAEKRLPVFVTCAESAEAVIEVVLSVYARRGRIPEPSEILFCSSQTTLEEIELIFYRFISAKRHARGHYVFTVADIHALPYTYQVSVLEKLREMLADFGTENAAQLLMVSGKPRQVLLNSLSGQMVELGPLDQKSLHSSLAEACKKWCGETLCVSSNINGGGKSHYIMSQIGKRQAANERLAYRRIPYHESSTSGTLVARLSKFTSGRERNAFHIDIGHIIPANANTCLFELLIVGVLKNPESCAVYPRSNKDIYFLEIPNSERNKTAEALRFPALLPKIGLRVSPETMSLINPTFKNPPHNTLIALPNPTSLDPVCYVTHFLKAYKEQKFLPGGKFDMTWNPAKLDPLKPDECFNLLREYTTNRSQPGDEPSYLIFDNFIKFMNAAFRGMDPELGYFLFTPMILEALEELKRIKHVFCNLMIETSKDFTLRAVPRGRQFGRVEKKHKPLPAPTNNQGTGRPGHDLFGNNIINIHSLGGPPPAAPALGRQTSIELQDAAAQAGGVNPELVRQASDNLAVRFQNMMKWDDTDHPVCVWYEAFRRGGGYDGFDILSLNKRFLNQYISPMLVENLKVQGLRNLDRDWSRLTSEEAMTILKKVEGWRLTAGSSDMKLHEISAGYVITIDNLLKMLSIQLRLRNGLPVMIMGETGCGKSSLIKQLTAVLRTPLRTLNIHGGMEADDVVVWMKERIEEAEFLSQEERVVIFLDEVNTCNCMGLFKEIICDRSVQGRFLPPSMKIIAACNPYRLKSKQALEQEAMAGLAFDTFQGGAENIGTGIRDPLKNLVYRVHPLPESMVDHVFDFGALPAETEALYVSAILKRQLSIYLRTEEKKKKTEEKKADTKVSKPSTQGNTKEEEMERIRALMSQAMNRTGNSRVRTQATNDLVTILNLQQSAQRSGSQTGGPSLNPEEMKKLMEEMEHKNTENDPFQEFVAVFAKLISASQEFVRKIHDGERSVVSLRDVARAVKVFCWFGEHFAKNVGNVAEKKWGVYEFFNVEPIARDYVRRAMIMALAYCFHARLGRDERKEFGIVIQKTWDGLQKPIGFIEKGTLYAAVFGGSTKKEPKYGPRCEWLELNASRFSEVIDKVMRDFVTHITIPKGIALNEALLENLFMIMVSILNKIPIFVVGKPGTSKSLAMGLIQQNMNGEASENAFLRSLPPVDIFSYQCSPLSTSDGIEQAFQAAARYKVSAPDTICVVLLDEVGLAEQSPHLPLKVLHKVLDEDHEYTLVGISNWALDPAKMNRAVHLYRPAPTVTDLSKTAQGMVQNAQLSGFLRKIARSYSTVYETQNQQDFWGLREFYSTVRHINLMLAADKKDAQLDAHVVMNAIQRNFGGKPNDMKRVLNIFYENMGINPAGAEMEDVVELIRQNISSREARHLMLLTKNNAALPLLFDYSLRKQDNTEVIFGSDFPADKTDLQVCLNLQNIKLCMAEGRTVVLVYCEDLYESLYDLLNQHYTEYGGKLYVRLAFGTASRLCEIHRSFRVIVIVEKIDAYNRLAPPLLNRFEKQVMERSSLLTSVQKQVEKNLRKFANIYAAGQEKQKPSMAELRSCFVGFHNDMLSSLVQSLPDPENIEDTTLDCINRLLWLATPESACRVMSMRQRNIALKQLCSIDVVETYFKKQHHSDFITFADEMFDHWGRDEMGVQTQVLTFSPMSLHSGDALAEHSKKWKKVTTRTLHELSSERDLKTAITDFFDTCNHGSVFVLQCDPQAASFRRIEHARYIIEHARSKFLRGRWKDVRDGKVTVDTEIEEKGEGKEGKESKGDGKVAPVAEEKVKIADEGKGTEGKAVEGKAAPEAKVTEGKVEAKGSDPAGPKGIHVVVLVHLPRGDLQFLIDFDKRWRMAFVDDIEPAANTGLPDIQAMLNTDLSMAQIMELLNLKQVLLASFRRALARLVYLHERTNEDVKEQIGFILNSLRSDKQFIEHVQDAVKEIVALSGKKLELMQAAKKEEDLALAGTFQAALHRQILDTLSSSFALLLSHMDRNTGLFLLSKAGPQIRDIWLYLFKRSCKDLGGFQLNAIKEGGAVEVLSDGSSSQSYRSRFPFSFFLNRLLIEFRALTQDSQNPAKSLQSQFQLLQWEFGIAEKMEKDVLYRYAYDFTCMNCAYSEHSGREQQARMLWKLITLKKGEQPEYLSQITAYFWQLENTVTAYFGLIDAVPDSLNVISNAIEEAKICGSELDITLVSHIITILSPHKQKWKAVEDYGDWMTKFEDVRPIIEGLIALSRRQSVPSKTVEDVANGWEKLLFTYTFIRDVSVPMKVDPELTLRTLEPTGKGELRTSAIFRAIVRMFSDLRFQIINPSDDYICPITLEPFKDPVILVDDGHVYERAAIEEWLTNHDLNPMTNLPLKSKALKAATELKDKLAALATEDGLKAAASRFMEFYLFELCFGATGKDVTDARLIMDFVAMLAGKRLKEMKKTAVDVVPSDAGKTFLLRKILELSQPRLKKGATDMIYKFMAMTVKKAKYLGTNLCVNFSSVQEQIFSEKVHTISDALQALPNLMKNLEHLEFSFNAKPKFSPEVVLTTISQFRHIVVIFASTIAEVLARKSDEEKEAKDKDKSELVVQLKKLSDYLEPLFSIKSPVVRSIRMYLLKNLERAHGISFLRSVLLEAPLKECKWMKAWKETAESGLLRFLGANKLPHNNPFKTLPLFSDVNSALATGLAPTSSGFKSIETLCSNIYTNQKNNIQALKAALLAAIFHQCYLLKVLPEVPVHMKSKISMIANWIKNSPHLAFLNASERELIAFFCWEKPPANFNMQLSSESKTEDIVLFRILVHIAVVALGSKNESLTKLFHTAILSPETLAGSWLPCMAEDTQAMAVRVLGGRWYKCSNGHAYFVDKCGRPTIIQKCATCGVKIGGLNHNLLPGQVDLDTGLEGNTNYSQKSTAIDKSPSGYTLKEAKEEKSPFDTVRSMTPIADRTQRLLIHSALLLSRLVRRSNWTKRISPLFDKEYSAEARKNPARFIENHVKGDWKILCKLVRRSPDDVGMLLHSMLAEVGSKVVDTNAVPAMAVEAKKPPVKCQPGWMRLDTIPKRDFYEKSFGKETVDIAFDSKGVGARLEIANKMYSSQSEEEAEVFTQELMERIDVKTTPVKMRQEYFPALWRYRSPFSLEDYTMELNINEENKAAYPVLSAFLSGEANLRALRHFPAAIEFQTLCLQKFNRSMTKDAARKLTIGQAIAQAPDKKRWREAFKGYRAAWNLGWKFVSRFTCLEIPQMLKAAKVDEKTPITMVLPQEKDEGICGLGIMNYLSRRHNQFVEIIYEKLLLRGQELQRNSSRKNVVSSKFFSRPHALSYDLDGKFIPFVAKQCVSISDGGDKVYNFDNAEQYLLDVFFVGKPLVEMELRMVQYTDDEGAVNTMLLKEKVDQEPLTREEQKQILNELGSPAAAHKCMRLLETCISFLQATGGSYIQNLGVGEKFLIEYVKDVLLMKDVDFGSHTIQSKIKLKHIDSLWKTLRDFTVKDPFENVHARYKEVLDAKDGKQLKTATKKLDLDSLVPTLQELIIQRLTEPQMSATAPIADFIGWAPVGENFMNDLSWFQHFPPKIPMSNIVDVYKLLSESHTQ